MEALRKRVAGTLSGKQADDAIDATSARWRGGRRMTPDPNEQQQPLVPVAAGPSLPSITSPPDSSSPRSPGSASILRVFRAEDDAMHHLNNLREKRLSGDAESDNVEPPLLERRRAVRGQTVALRGVDRTVLITWGAGGCMVWFDLQ